MSWSSGKDSAWALYQLQQDPTVTLEGLFCTINKKFQRVAMHGVRVALLQKQADCLGLPLEIIELPFPCSDKEYAEIMSAFVERTKQSGIEQIAFGDLFLEDIRDYRIEQLAESGIKPIFPIWGIPTDRLIQDMIDGGLKAVVSCVDPKQAPETLAGKIIDKDFIKGLPEGVDPCGENGEFHSFVFDGPMFVKKVPKREVLTKDVAQKEGTEAPATIEVVVGEVVTRDGFVFADLMLAD